MATRLWMRDVEVQHIVDEDAREEDAGTVRDPPPPPFPLVGASSTPPPPSAHRLSSAFRPVPLDPTSIPSAKHLHLREFRWSSPGLPSFPAPSQLAEVAAAS